MFMGKNELENIQALTKVKLRNSKWFLVWSGIIMVTIFAINLTSNMIMLIKTTDFAVSIYMLDFSTLFLVFLMIFLIIYQITYRQTNDLYAVYPQTNTSRFQSSLLYQYEIIAMLGSMNLVLYLFEFALFRFLSNCNNNIVILLEFNLSFILIGFLTFLAYAFVAVSVLSLLGALLRKIGYFALPVVVALLSLFIANLQWSIKLIQKISAFITGEQSIPLFFLKCLLLWTVCTTAAILINKYTVYQTSKRKLSIGFAAACIGIALFVIISSATLSYTIGGSGTSSILTFSEGNANISNRMVEIPLDVSEYPKGSELRIVLNDKIIRPVSKSIVRRDNNSMYYSGEETRTIDSEMLYVYYHYPFYGDNSYNLNLVDYVNPHFTAVLKDDTLYLDFTYVTNRKIVILPIWSMASQFACYDINVVKKGIGKSFSTGTGGIMIMNKKLTFE